MKFYVYHYCDPESGIPFYVGKGEGRRAYSHLTACKRLKNCCFNTFFYKKLRKMFSMGIKPDIKIIHDYLEEKEALKLEASEIKHIGRRNHGEGTLCNLSLGGNSSGMLGHKHSKESKRKMSESQTGHFVNTETRQKISKAHQGKKASQETKQKMRMARLGKPRKDLLGKKHTEETRLKMSTSSLHRPIESFDSTGNLVSCFDSIKAVEKQGYIRCCVSNCLAGRQKTHRGLYWRYSDA